MGSTNHEWSKEFVHNVHTKQIHTRRPKSFFKNHYLEDFKSLAGDWLGHKEAPVERGKTKRKHVRGRELTHGLYACTRAPKRVVLG